MDVRGLRREGQGNCCETTATRCTPCAQEDRRWTHAVAAAAAAGVANMRIKIGLSRVLINSSNKGGQIGLFH